MADIKVIFDSLRDLIFKENLTDEELNNYMKLIEETKFINGISILYSVVEKNVSDYVGRFLYKLENSNLSDYYKFIFNKKECIKFMRNICIAYNIKPYCFNYKNVKIREPKNKLSEEDKTAFIRLIKNSYIQADQLNYILDISPELLKENIINDNNIINISNKENKDIIELDRKIQSVNNNKSEIDNFKTKLDNILNSKFTSNCLYSYCEKCSLRNNKYVLPDIIINDKSRPDTIDIMIVGMNPYEEEIKQNKVFAGRSGKILRYFISKHFNNLNVIITNACMCYIADNKDPNKDVLNRCNKLLFSQINKLKPKVIIPLGKIAISAVLQKDIKSVGNYIGNIIDMDDYIIIPNYHPSYIVRKGGLSLLKN